MLLRQSGRAAESHWAAQSLDIFQCLEAAGVDTSVLHLHLVACFAAWGLGPETQVLGCVIKLLLPEP